MKLFIAIGLTALLAVSGFSALGDQSGDDFFIDFIRHMNGDQPTGAR